LGFEKPLRELPIGEILGQAFNLYFSKFFLFYLPFLAVGIPSSGMSEALLYLMPAMPAPDASEEVIFSWAVSSIGFLVVALPLIFLVGWILSTIISGMTVKVASDSLEGKETDVSEALNYTVKRLPSLLGAGIASGFLIILGVICLFVPGIIVMIMFSLITPVIIIERSGALESLSRSKNLVSRRWLKTFGLLIVIGIIFGVAYLLFDAIGSIFGPIDWIINGILFALVEPILPIAVTFYYYSMFTKENMAFTQSPSSPTGAEPATPSLQNLQKIYCAYCGAENFVDANFCENCGKKVFKTKSE